MTITNKGLMISALIIALAVVLGTGVVGYSMFRVKALQNVIAVTGSAEKTIASDTVKWTSGFSRTVGIGDLKAGYAMMSKDLQQTLEYFKAQGITEQELTVKPVSMMQNYEGDKYGGASRMTGYVLQQTIEIQSTNVEGITKLAQDTPVKLSDLGILFSSQNLEYYYSKFSDLKIEMLADATKNARSRAEKIAESTNAQIGFLQSAAMGVFQVTAVNSMDVSDYGYFDTASINKKVTAVVRASFSLK